MRLFWNTRCGSFAPEVVAAEAGIDYERVRADHRSDGAGFEELKRYNPMAQIPTLLLDDGRVLTESAAICLWFSELKPETGLLPPAASAERAWVLRWLLFLATELYPVDLLESYPERYLASPAHAESLVQGAGARLDRDWAILEAELGEGPYLLGETFTLVDPYMAMMMAWHREPKALLARSPKLKRLLETTVARPKIAPLWEAYGMNERL